MLDATKLASWGGHGRVDDRKILPTLWCFPTPPSFFRQTCGESLGLSTGKGPLGAAQQNSSEAEPRAVRFLAVRG